VGNLQIALRHSSPAGKHGPNAQTGSQARYCERHNPNTEFPQYGLLDNY